MKTMKIIEKRNMFYALSLGIILVGFGLMGLRAMQNQPVLNFGIDFTGGTSLLIKFSPIAESNTPAGSGKIRQALTDYGLEKIRIQNTASNELLITTPLMSQETRTEVLTKLESQFGTVELLEADEIGPSIGHELRKTSLLIVVFVSLALMAYISWRFEFRYGVGALVSLIHDIFAMLAIAAIVGLDIDTAFVAAILTILGYSINDTVVVFDRIRENMRRMDQNTFTFPEIINASIVQTFRRTIFTSVTVMLVIISLLIFEGGTIGSFCWTLFFGVIVGTYSSIFIGSTVLGMMKAPVEESVEPAA